MTARVVVEAVTDPDEVAIHQEIAEREATLRALPVVERFLPQHYEPVADLVARLPVAQQEGVTHRLLDRHQGVLPGLRAETWRQEVALAHVRPELAAVAQALAGRKPSDVGTDPACAQACRALADVLVRADKATAAAAEGALRRLFLQFKAQQPGAKLWDRARAEARAAAQGGSPLAESAFHDPEAWPEAVDGAALLTDLAAVFRRHLILPHRAPEALALWVVYTYIEDVFDVSPYLAITSPTLRCGKSTALRVLRRLVRRAWPVIFPTPSTVYRMIADVHPSLLIDEVDAFLDNEELRGVLDSGHERELAWVPRTVSVKSEDGGTELVVERFPTFCPKAFGVIGKLPPSLHDRSIEIPMKRKRRDEPVERLRRNRPDLEPLRRQAARWAEDHREALREAEPALPDALNDRTADNWEPLLAIADLAGGDWPALAREAAVALSAGGVDEEERAGVQVLADIRAVFAQQRREHLSSAQLVSFLTEPPDSRWREWGKDGRPLSQHKLAKLVRSFGVRPKNHWFPGGQVLKGYHLSDFADPFSRYLNPLAALDTHESEGLGMKNDPLGGAGLAGAKPVVTHGNFRQIAPLADTNLAEGVRAERVPRTPFLPKPQGPERSAS